MHKIIITWIGVLALFFVGNISSVFAFDENNDLGRDVRIIISEEDIGRVIEHQSGATDIRLEEQQEQIREAALKKTCDHIDDIQDQMNERIDIRSEINVKIRDNNIRKITKQAEDATAKLVIRRNERDALRTLYYERLHSRTVIQTQDDAVNKFQKEIEVAVNQRRSAIDAINKLHENALINAILRRADDIEDLVSIHRKYINADIADVRRTCASSNSSVNDLSELMQVLGNTIIVTGGKFEQEKEDITKVDEISTVLREERTNAIKAVVEVFKNDMDKAQANFDTSQ